VAYTRRGRGLKRAEGKERRAEGLKRNKEGRELQKEEGREFEA
jgi:hypothetical protein